MKTTTHTLLIAYLLALVLFLLLDACWLMLMGPRLYAPALGPLMAPSVDWAAALLFYVLYIVGLVALAVQPALAGGSPGIALRRGALLGLVAYATYDLTNQATLQGWPWRVTLADLAWGTFVTGVSAWAAARLTSPPESRTGAR